MTAKAAIPADSVQNSDDDTLRAGGEKTALDTIGTGRKDRSYLAYVVKRLHC